MKYVKRIITAFVFIIGLAGLLIVFSFLFMPKNNMAGFGMEEAQANGILGEKPNTVDIVILGDSESYSSFIPLQIWKETGYTAYICGTSKQTLDYTDIMLKRAFSKHTPKIVILETNAIFRAQSNKHILYSKLAEKLSVFRYHNRWKTLRWSDFKKSAEFTWSDDYKGYRYSLAAEPSKKTDHMKPTDRIEKIPEINRRFVTQIKDFCDKHGAKLILISTPSTVNWNTARHNGIAGLSEELKCEYIDMNFLTKDIPIDWNKDTRDSGNHLNYYGAKKVTSFISDYFKKTELLTSHKGDSGYKKWDECLSRFENVIPK